MDHNVPIDDIVYFQIEKAHKTMRKYTQQLFNQAGYDITVDQFVILKMLTEDKERSQTDIAKATAKDNASITRIIEQLVRKGYVNKHPGKDKRTSDYETTPQGEKYLEEVLPLVYQIREKGVEQVSEDDLNTTLATLKKIVASFS